MNKQEMRNVMEKELLKSLQEYIDAYNSWHEMDQNENASSFEKYYVKKWLTVYTEKWLTLRDLAYKLELMSNI